MSLTFDMCKNLKEKGFPQPKDYCKDCDFFRWYDDEGTFFTSMEVGNEDTWEESNVYIPTLEELIEALGEDFKELYKVSHWWVAASPKNIETPELDSPIEAVYNLYMAVK